MGCTSCHDPHTLPAEEKKVAFYRERCLNCHKERGCSLPLAARQEKQDNCLNCHMPKTGSTLNHTAITDHSIPRCAGRVERKEEATLDLVPFHRDRVDDPELGRDLGIALVKLADTQSGESARSLSEKAWPMLDAAVRRHSDDLAAWEALGSAMWFQGRLEDAFATFQTVLDRAPMRENTLFLMTTLSLRLRRVEAARGYADRLLKVNPHRWRYHFVLAQAQGQANQWRAALQAGEAARKLNPAEFGVRQLVVLCHLRLGEVEKAQQELETMLRLNAPQPEALRAWFEKERLR
jgi:tetratricopeptide (TPR) repeat protein